MIACIVQAYYLSLNAVRKDQTCAFAFVILCGFAAKVTVLTYFSCRRSGSVLGWVVSLTTCRCLVLD